MTRRNLQIIVFGISFLILAKVGLNIVVNPLNPTRNALAEALDEIPPNAPLSNDGIADYALWIGAIESVPTLWQEIVTPPPPPPPPPPPKPKRPDLLEKLATVFVGKGQIGTTKIKIFTDDAPRGRWLQVGAKINGCTLESFDRDEAIFSLYWEEGKQTLEVALPRE